MYPRDIRLEGTVENYQGRETVQIHVSSCLGSSDKYRECSGKKRFLSQYKVILIPEVGEL